MERLYMMENQWETVRRCPVMRITLIVARKILFVKMTSNGTIPTLSVSNKCSLLFSIYIVLGMKLIYLFHFLIVKILNFSIYQNYGFYLNYSGI